MGHSTGTALFAKQKKNGQTELSLLNLTVISVGSARRLSHLKYGCFAKSLSEALRTALSFKMMIVVPNKTCDACHFFVWSSESIEKYYIFYLIIIHTALVVEEIRKAHLFSFSELSELSSNPLP